VSCIDRNYSVCFGQTNNSSRDQESSFTNNNMTCYSALKSLENLKSSSVVKFCRKEYVLNFLLSVVNVSNVLLEGGPHRSIFRCTANAGLQLLNSKNITFRHTAFIECSHQFCRTQNRGNEGVCNDSIMASLFAFNSSSIEFHEISIINGTGLGVVLINMAGKFSNCTFSGNSVSESQEPGGGGMHVELDNRHNESKYYLTISDCSFTNNTSKTPRYIEKVPCDTQLPVPLGLKGGGLVIILRKSIFGEIIISLNNCTFKHNVGHWGGGMYLQYCTSTGNANASIVRTKFLYNEAKEAGGGLDIGYQHNPSEDTRDSVGINTLYCEACCFEHNKSYLGGGTAMFTDDFTNSGRNFLIFRNSSWSRNEAYYGMAIDLSPRLINTPTHKYLIEALFIDVAFSENSKWTNNSTQCYTSKRFTSFQKSQSGGIFLVTELKVAFQNSVSFSFNKDSAIYATSAILEFRKNANAIFKGNQAVSGAAIALIGFSAIHVDSDVKIYMINNSASAKGGAIYHESISKHDYTFSRTCFIQLMNATETSLKGIVFSFTGNRAGSGTNRDGNAIFTTTLHPCVRYYSYLYSRETTADQVFSSIRDFQYDQDADQEIATRPQCMTAQSDKELEVIPGYSTDLLFNNTDDLNKEVQGIYNIKSDGSIEIDKKSVFTSLKAVTINGKPGSQGKITITNVDRREASITFKVKLRHCPPFYVHNIITGKCECFSNSNYKYDFLFSCNAQDGDSSLFYGYWIGTLDNTMEEIYYAYCPFSYCFMKDDKLIYSLPNNTKYLNGALCDQSGRTGPICGHCKQNYSAHYHSDSILCGNEKTCSYGWLLYIAAEIIPLTLFFLVIIACCVNFTSGPLNGFLFFSQAYVSIYKTGETYVFSHSQYLFQAILAFYKIFNLDFFGIDALSFCLWKGATSLEMLAFTYLTVVIGFFLVIGTVYALNRFMVLNKILNNQNMPLSVTHGLSTFLVMIYMRFTKVSFDILHFNKVYNLDRTRSYAAVFYQGNVEAFSREHAPFALLAITFLIPITLIPPLLLTTYPLCLKLTGFQAVSKLKLRKIFSRIPMSKLKPVFDTFQGSFRDSHRYFGGIYFVHRVVLLLTTLIPQVSLTLVIFQIELTFMLVLHALCWPYIKKAHNIVDGLLFCNLCVINILTLLKRIYTKNGKAYASIVHFAFSLKVFLTLLPLLCLCGYMITSVWKTFRRKNFKVQTPKIADHRMSISMIDSREGSVKFDYEKFESESFEIN